MTEGRHATSLTAEAYLAWSLERHGGARHELLDGAIVAMGAECAGHARIKAKVNAALARQITERALPCEAFPDGMAVRVDDVTVFEPDALVRCGSPLDDEAVIVTDPVVVVEVVSPSTQRIDVLVKLARYFRNASLVHYLIVLPGPRLVIHHRRAASGAIETTSHDSDGPAHGTSSSSRPASTSRSPGCFPRRHSSLDGRPRGQCRL